jgi:hypothetical protein
VDEEHARVAPALGAYAAGALEPGEAAEVEAHLAACAACRAEAGQPPPEAGSAAEALAAATADLDDLLAGLTAEQWRLPVVHGWDVDELLRHLAAAQPPAAAGPDAALRQAFETWIHADDLRAALGRPPSPPGPDHLHGVLAMGMRLLPPAVRDSAWSVPAGPSPCAWRGRGAGPGRYRPPGPSRRRPPSPPRRPSSST